MLLKAFASLVFRKGHSVSVFQGIWIMTDEIRTWTVHFGISSDLDLDLDFGFPPAPFDSHRIVAAVTLQRLNWTLVFSGLRIWFSMDSDQDFQLDLDFGFHSDSDLGFQGIWISFSTDSRLRSSTTIPHMMALKLFNG